MEISQNCLGSKVGRNFYQAKHENIFWPRPNIMHLFFPKKKKFAVNEHQKVRKCITCKESGLALVIVQGVNRCWHKYFQAVTLRITVLPDISCTYYTYRQIWIGKWDFYIKNCWRRGSLLYGFQDSFAGIMHMYYSRALIVAIEALKIWLGRSFSIYDNFSLVDFHL